MLSRRRTQCIAVFAMASLFVFFLNTPVSAETYQWTDKNGSVGFADSLEKVPPEYRKSAKRLQENKSGKNSQTVPGTPESGYTAPSEYSLSQDPDYWRARILAAHEQLEGLKAQRQKAQEEWEYQRRGLFRWGFADPEIEAKASGKLQELDQQIRNKEHELSNMTDEARRAGVPSSALSP